LRESQGKTPVLNSDEARQLLESIPTDSVAAHESPKMTKLYDRTADTITLDEIERIGI
jgi:hypothetical protein